MVGTSNEEREVRLQMVKGRNRGGGMVSTSVRRLEEGRKEKKEDKKTGEIVFAYYSRVGYRVVYSVITYIPQQSIIVYTKGV